MNKNDKRIITTIIDSQEVLFPTKEGWKEIEGEPVIDDIEVYYDESLKRDIIYIEKISELSLGLRHIPALKCWIPLVFLEINNYLQRCHLERLKCNSCGWEGITAYPLLIDLYVLLPNKEELIQNAKKLEKKKCPQCNSELPRFPVWIEPSSQSKK